MTDSDRAKARKAKQKLPGAYVWLPVPDWPYEVTAYGDLFVRRVPEIDARGRRIGGVMRRPTAAGTVSIFRVLDDGTRQQRNRSARQLRLEAWAARDASQSS